MDMWERLDEFGERVAHGTRKSDLVLVWYIIAPNFLVPIALIKWVNPLLLIAVWFFLSMSAWIAFTMFRILPYKGLIGLIFFQAFLFSGSTLLLFWMTLSGVLK